MTAYITHQEAREALSDTGSKTAFACLAYQKLLDYIAQQEEHDKQCEKDRQELADKAWDLTP